MSSSLSPFFFLWICHPHLHLGFILGTYWGHLCFPSKTIFLSNLKYVANYMPFALKFLCFFLRCFLLWFVQGDNVLLPIPFVHVKEGGGGTKEASHNRSNHCNRLQGGERFFVVFLTFKVNGENLVSLIHVIVQARWYCNKSCFYGGDIGGQFKGNIIRRLFKI